MKRSLVTMSVAMLIAGTATAEPTSDPFDSRLRPIPSEQTMSAQEVERYAMPYLQRVSRCYKQHALPVKKATGELRLYVVIARSGNVVYSEIGAPGVPILRKLGLDRCLRNEMKTWRFPVHAGFTNAVLPYFFQRTYAPASGPFPNT
jgi:hypothetical protein